MRRYVSAYDYDAETGEQAWRWFVVPGNPELPFEDDSMKRAAETWDPAGKWWVEGGGGTIWDAMAYDPELDLLYVGTGNGTPWNRLHRSPAGGDNLYLASVVALDPNTGEYQWHYQHTPGDNWDFTSTQHIILADLEIEAEMRKILLQAPKNGFFYVIDRTNGGLISAEPFVEVTLATGHDEDGCPIEAEGVRSATDPIDAMRAAGSTSPIAWPATAYRRSTMAGRPQSWLLESRYHQKREVTGSDRRPDGAGYAQLQGQGHREGSGADRGVHSGHCGCSQSRS